MQQDRGMCTTSARPIAAQPLTDLQQNVLSGCPRLQLKRKTGCEVTSAAKAIIPNDSSRLSLATSMQMRLKAIGLSQYADAFAKEEIDEEVLPCLTVRDLQSLGVCNHAHQRLILSAAMQPATQQVARPHSKGHSAAASTPTLSTHTLSTHTLSMKDREASKTGSFSTDAVLPNKAVPKGGLQSIASAVAASRTKAGMAAPPSSSRLSTAHQAVHTSHAQPQPLQSCKSIPAADATVAGAAARTVCPPQASAASRGSARGASTIVRGAARVGTKAVGTTAATVNTGAVAATARHAVPASQSFKPPAKSDGAAAEKAVATVEKAVATAVKAALLPAPQSKAEEAGQLAMALLASMSAGATSCGLEQGLVDPSKGASVVLQPASQAASQGVFSTMMAASKQKSKPAAPVASVTPAPAVSAVDICCRTREEGLLARVFAPPATSSAARVVLSVPCSHRLKEASSQAQPVSPSRSLWVYAGRSDPPGCQLQKRVQKRKAEAAMQAEVVKQQRAEQPCNAPDVSLPSSQSALHVPSSVDNDQFGNCSAEAADCIALISPHENAHDKSSEGRCMSSQPSQPVAQQASVRTMDPVRRMRLDALQQELRAARQTVCDLERMIKAEELG